MGNQSPAEGTPAHGVNPTVDVNKGVIDTGDGVKDVFAAPQPLHDLRPGPRADLGDHMAGQRELDDRHRAEGGTL